MISVWPGISCSAEAARAAASASTVVLDNLVGDVTHEDTSEYTEWYILSGEPANLFVRSTND